MAENSNKTRSLIRVVIVLFIVLGAALVLRELGVNLIEHLNNK